jgi:ornithine carbamoyltransferase
VTSEKLHLAKQGFFFLPCPPVTRGEEVSEEVMQTWGAAVYEAKEYLLHAQNAILSFVL